MDNYEFGALVEDHFILYLTCLFLIGITYYVLYKKIVLTIIDPFFIYILSTVFATADVFLLYFTKSISPFFFSSFLFSQITFLIGFFLLSNFRKKKIWIKPIININFSLNRIFIICIIFFIIYFIIQLSVYYIRGIPLLFDSRLDYYNEGGGFGIMSRILGVLSTFVCFLIVKIAVDYYKALSLFKWISLFLMFLFYILTQVLSGGKSSVLNPFVIIFSYMFINDKKHIIKSISKKYSILIALILLSLVSIVITVQAGDDQISPLLAIFYRLIVSGDVYWYVYPNSVIYTYHIKANGFTWLFNDFLGFFRIISWSDLGTHPGVYYYNYHHPTDATRGPNIRHNVFGLLYFGYYGGIIYSFFLGLFLSFFRFVLASVKSQNLFFKFCAMYLFLNCSMIEPDVTLFLFALNNLFILLPIIIIITFLILSFLNIDEKRH